MDVAIFNTTDTTKRNVFVELTSTSPYVSFDSGHKKLNYGTVRSNLYRSYYYDSTTLAALKMYTIYDIYMPFMFNISSSCPARSTIPFTVTITCGSEIYTDSFTLQVY